MTEIKNLDGADDNELADDNVPDDRGGQTGDHSSLGQIRKNGSKVYEV